MAVASLNDFEDNLETQLTNITETGDIIRHFRHLIRQDKQKSTIALEIFENDKITLDLLYSKELS
ncbi:MAG: hypothetical protein AEth_00170 [Candidatus Argoarchaeum ethanivorans]|uniref:Uncharacterized protein n=1 Tax=Candidatus Argoarchaeum ethanivorans TaxID=2608793 RepID=A0A8B3S423_9EURY|nr:MAG: hypothetical protein AEth_00170 [Candidatus Argoarchaeum ethanivorans]